MGDIVIFIGPPGSGKGSLSQYCTTTLGWRQLSTGDLCRIHIQQQTSVGQHIDFIIKSGKLISDELMAGMVKEWLDIHAASGKPVILDGFPRTEAQARLLEQFLVKEFPQYRLHIVFFNISDDKATERLSTRTVCGNSGCQAVYSLSANSFLAPKNMQMCDKCCGPLVQRKDDASGTITERLKIYHMHEQHLLNFFTTAGRKVMYLNAEKPLEQVYEDLLALFPVAV